MNAKNITFRNEQVSIHILQGVRYAGGLQNAYELTSAGGRLNLFE